MSNEELRKNVIDELLWDPKIEGPTIAVSTRDGMVTLRSSRSTRRSRSPGTSAA
jgi:hypothetical protein